MFNERVMKATEMMADLNRVPDESRNTLLFHPQEWTSPRIRSLSLEARGLLIELICLAYNNLETIEKFPSLSIDTLTRLVGGLKSSEHSRNDNIIEALRELHTSGIVDSFIPGFNWPLFDINSKLPFFIFDKKTDGVKNG